MRRSMFIPIGKAGKTHLCNSPRFNNATDTEKDNALVLGGKE
jgi:hypothetical protein